MAYQTKAGRSPLRVSKNRKIMQRRSSEMLGFGLIALGIICSLILGSYDPRDTGLFSASDQATQNLLGATGATLANFLIMLIGMAAWCLPLALFVWGIRHVAHQGEGRFMKRILFFPFMIGAWAVFLATHIPYAGWRNSVGLGGFIGDSVLAFLIDLSPLSIDLGLLLITLSLAVITMVLSLLAMGVDRHELRRFIGFLWVATLVTYDNLMRVFMHALRSLVEAWGLLVHWCVVQFANYQARKAEQAREAVLPAAPAPPAKLHPQPVYATPVAYAQEPEHASAVFDDADVYRPEDTQGGLAGEVAPAVSSQERHSAQSDADNRISNRIQEAIRTTFLKNRRGAVAAAQAQESGQSASVRLGGVTREDMHAPPTPPSGAPYVTPLSVDMPGAARFEPDARRPSQAVVHSPQPSRALKPSREALSEQQPELRFRESSSQGSYERPTFSLLRDPSTLTRHVLSEAALMENARMLEGVLADYGVKGDIIAVRPGPVVTLYELEPAPGLKASRVIGLADDIARSMSALSARVSTMPGRSVIGIELPNANRETVLLREILSASSFTDRKTPLPLALGKDIGGEGIVANLAKMPHLLIAGTTGSGKSVAINTMILSLLYRLTPEECRLIMIDPKMLELSVYDGIPHLLSPVVTDPKKAVVALKWVVGEMEERYRKMSRMGVRNIDGYNARVEDALRKGEDFSRTVQIGFDDETGEPAFETQSFTPEKMPYIVVIVDEMADLMMVAGKEIEACIQRLAQMARASGIHLIMATQRPSVDVITGTIKANFPTRISFQVTSKIDSRTILGEMGAEQLLGMGDMLYMAGGGKITRIHAPFVSDEEVEVVVQHLKSFGPPDYLSGVIDGPDEDKESDIDLVLGLGGNTSGEDALYDQAVAIVAKDRKCSTSYIQRKLGIGYNKAARLVEQMEDEGIVSSANHVGKREILIPEA